MNRAQFTSKLEGMITDISLAADMQKQFREYLSHRDSQADYDKWAVLRAAILPSTVIAQYRLFCDGSDYWILADLSCKVNGHSDGGCTIIYLRVS